MNTKKHQLENYRKFLLNRLTATAQITEYIENCLSTEDEIAKYTFHKIMVHNWTESDTKLFDILGEYYSPNFIPVSYASQGDIASFYTSSLSLVAKITKLDFMFPHQRNMYNIDILFNDKSSVDCFDNQITIEDIVTGVVSRRFSDKFELDLSNFCNDPEFLDKRIHFYKITLLSNFKLLMLRMGRDTKMLNLSNNNLSVIPAEILNFFIKGELIAVNLSDNNIPSISELQRVSSKIEKLWIEGNPLCKDLDPVTYVKSVAVKFPRLNELDGVSLNEHGVMLPFYKNFLATPDTGTKMLVEKFLSIYFTHYDSSPRKKIAMFYDTNAVMTLVTNFKDPEEQLMPVYANHSRNILHPSKKRFVVLGNKMYRSRDSIAGVLFQFPESKHDPSTFTVDVLRHDNQCLILIVDGVYKEKPKDAMQPERFFRFRRTFVFHIHTRTNTTKEYFIVNEMFNVSFATKELINTSFKNTSRSLNPLALQNPDSEDIETIVKIFSQLTHLKSSEAERRLKKHNWAMFKAMKELLQEMRLSKVSSELFFEEEDFSDSSSLVDDEID